MTQFFVFGGELLRFIARAPPEKRPEKQTHDEKQQCPDETDNCVMEPVVGVGFEKLWVHER